MPSPGRRRLLRGGLVAIAVLLLALGGTVAALLLHSPGNVSHPDLSFTTSTTSTAAPPPTTHPKKKAIVVDNSLWPRYGYNAGRTRYYPNGKALDPPLHIRWAFDDHALLEFPPSIYQNTLYMVDDNGSAKAVDKRNGHELWNHRVGTLAAASPAIGVRQHLVFIPVLSNRGHSPGQGQIVALSMRTGHQVWARQVPAGTESSPLAWNRTVYLGDNGGNLYSLDASTGHVNWTYHASAAVKGGPALSDGILYFGDYSGRAYAVNAVSGHEVWAVSTEGTHFGFGSGNFYSSPAVAFGRVYMGNTDGRVYSFAARTGQLAWATGTGAYVYSSPAVADLSGIGPTVYMGSYDGNFYAFNAQSGAVRWKHYAGGRISGSATIVGDVVYFSNLGSKSTTGLNVLTGQRVFVFPDGAFNPVITDGKAIYLVGYAKVYALAPKSSAVAAPRPHTAAKHPKHAVRHNHRKHATRHHRSNHHRAAHRSRARRK